jgi:hypothetical protein
MMMMMMMMIMIKLKVNECHKSTEVSCTSVSIHLNFPL